RDERCWLSVLDDALPVKPVLRRDALLHEPAVQPIPLLKLDDPRERIGRGSDVRRADRLVSPPVHGSAGRVRPKRRRDNRVVDAPVPSSPCCIVGAVARGCVAFSSSARQRRGPRGVLRYCGMELGTVDLANTELRSMERGDVLVLVVYVVYCAI